MKKFLTLFDKIRTREFYNKDKTFTPEILLDCKPFVVEHDGTVKDITSVDVTKPIDSIPFKCSSVEFSKGEPLQVIKADIQGIGSREMLFTCYIFVEVKPLEFIYLGLCENERGESAIVARELLPEDIRPTIDNAATSTLVSFLQTLDTHQIGHIDPNHRVKLRHPDTRKKISKTINQVVYVRPKKKSEEQINYFGRTVEWNHRWAVRGHWRKCDGKIGKDREGVYNVENFTWVKEHIRGPEDAPVVMKQRIVTNGLQA